MTELITARATAPSLLDPNLRRVLATRIAARAPGRHLGALRLDSYRLLKEATQPGAARSAFQWSPRTSRRLLGLAAARRVVSGRAASPLAAVITELDAVAERASSARARPGALGSWLAEAPDGVRAAVIAEATGYATDVLGLLEVGRLAHGIEIGRPDPVWAVPGAPWISLKARRDLEVPLDPTTRARSLVALRSGRPTARSLDDLGFVALADALSRPDDPVASRVIGVWPSSGRSVSLEVDAETMRRAARLVVSAIENRSRAAQRAVAA
jgi:hypothetical protein